MNKKQLLKMKPEEFDKYMCETYPEIFRERNLPMSQTCMCWGFEIGRGWYDILDKLCYGLELIRKQTNLLVVFQQIKEKFGGARFYHTIDGEKCILDDKEQQAWCDIIDAMVDGAENTCEHTCAECGGDRYDMIVIGRWIYDVCEKCFIKQRPNSKKDLLAFRAKNNLIQTITNYIYNQKYEKMLSETVNQIKKDIRKKEKEAKLDKIQQQLPLGEKK